MTLEEAITKCLIGEEHLDQAEYEQVGEWLEELNKVKQELNEVKQELKLYKRVFAKACETLSRVRINNDCGIRRCPLEHTVRYDSNPLFTVFRCPDCHDKKVWEEHFINEVKITQSIGFLKLGDYFIFKGKRYRVGHIIANTNGYVACVGDDGKVHRFYIDTIVQKVGEEE